MEAFIIPLVLVLAVGGGYAISLILAVRLRAAGGDLLSSRWSADGDGLRVELSIDRGPRRAIVDTITMERKLAEASLVQPPNGFLAAAVAPPPSFEDFEPDLDELAGDHPGGDIPEAAVERERRRQYDEWQRLHDAAAARTITWRGRLRVRRGEPSVLHIPMRPDLARGGLITFGVRYRIGLVGSSDAHALRLDNPR